jgi:exosortase
MVPAIISALVLVCYRSVIWMTLKLLLANEDMAQGLFAPIVAMYIVWTARDDLLHPGGPPSFWSLPVLGFAGLLGVAGTLGNSSTLSRFALLITIEGCLLVFGGWPAMKRFQFPVLLLLFTFPIPVVLYGELTQPLQLISTQLSKWILESFGYSVLREGNILQLPHMKLSVIEACSGLRSLVTLGFVCIVYSYFFELRPWLRAALVALAVPVAILINALRITGTGIIGTYDQAYTVGTYHEALGWACFLLGFVIILGIHRLIPKTVAV